jgi:ubiquinone/menaquinone biosynthesis C-methylase UbiE
MFSDPVKNIEQCGIQAGMQIADLGAGSGFYSLAACKALIATGKVYAIDAQKDLLTKLKNTATKEGIYNIEVVWGDIEKQGGTHLRDSVIDLCLICNVLFQVTEKKNLLNEAKRILKPGAKVLVVDWSDSFGGIGPKADHVVNREAAVALFEQSGFSVEKEINAGSHHYGIIFKKM